MTETKLRLSNTSAHLRGQPMFNLPSQAREMKKAGRYIISLELGDSQFDSPREAFYWAKVALSAGLTHYTDVRPTPRRTVEIWMRPLENIR